MAKWRSPSVLLGHSTKALLRFHLFSITTEFSKWKADRNTAMWNYMCWTVFQKRLDGINCRHFSKSREWSLEWNGWAQTRQFSGPVVIVIIGEVLRFKHRQIDILSHRALPQTDFGQIRSMYGVAFLFSHCKTMETSTPATYNFKRRWGSTKILSFIEILQCLFIPLASDFEGVSLSLFKKPKNAASLVAHGMRTISVLCAGS